MRRAQLLRRLKGEQGVTLVELLVTSMVLGVMLTMVIAFFSSFSRTMNVDQASTTSMTTAAIGMNELTRVVRAGTEIPVQGQTLNTPVFLAAGREQVLMHAFLDTSSTDPAPIKVRFSINNSRELVETRWASYPINNSYWGFYPAVDSEKIVARKIVAPATGQPYLFTYYTKDGVALVPDQNGWIASAALRTIASVRISMTVQADVTNRADPVQLQNTVGIPNLGISRVGAVQ